MYADVRQMAAESTTEPTPMATSSAASAPTDRHVSGESSLASTAFWKTPVSTIATASLSTLSPKSTLKSRLGARLFLSTTSVATGSIAESSAPYKSASAGSSSVIYET